MGNPLSMGACFSVTKGFDFGDIDLKIDERDLQSTATWGEAARRQAKQEATPPTEPAAAGGGPVDLERVAELIRTLPDESVIVLVGAGASVSAGIPDFRTPGTGLYDNLASYNLPAPEAM